MAEPNSQQARRPQAHRQAISRHPLFPAIVALWFAALLGLGGFALSIAALEALVLAGHVDALVPAAAPPLGATARLAMALGLGLVGAAIGFVLARRFGNPRQVAAPQVFKVADVELSAPQWPGVADLDDAPMLAPAEPEDAPMLVAAVLVTDGMLAEVTAPMFDPAGPAEEITAEPNQLALRPLKAAQRLTSADLHDLSHVELIERLAIALQRREDLLNTAGNPAGETNSAVIRFPDQANRRGARHLPAPAPSSPASQETEKALRAALAQLQRMSSNA